MDIEYIKPKFRYFECSRCSFKFLKKISESTSGIARCQNCEYPCIEYRLKGRFGQDTDILKTMPIYSQMKYYWLKNPKAWEENIKNRSTQNMSGGNKKTYLNDSSGHRIGEMPQAIEI